MDTPGIKVLCVCVCVCICKIVGWAVDVCVCVCVFFFTGNFEWAKIILAWKCVIPGIHQWRWITNIFVFVLIRMLGEQIQVYMNSWKSFLFKLLQYFQVCTVPTMKSTSINTFELTLWQQIVWCPGFNERKHKHKHNWIINFQEHSKVILGQSMCFVIITVVPGNHIRSCK